jgi:quercetin dioxygenase-like cupin family protein
MLKLMIVSLAAVVAAASPAYAKSNASKWMAGPPGLPAGATFMVVSGNPGKEGAFVVRAKLPANYTVPPHHHPGDEVVRVISAGSLNYGMGDKVDTANLGTLNKGYHVTMQPGMNHWVSTTDPVEIQVSGTGPFAITYVNPADDPRGAK